MTKIFNKNSEKDSSNEEIISLKRNELYSKIKVAEMSASRGILLSDINKKGVYKKDYEELNIKFENLLGLYNQKIVELEKVKVEFQKQNNIINELNNHIDILIKNNNKKNNCNHLSFEKRTNKSEEESKDEKISYLLEENKDLRKRIGDVEINLEKMYKVKLEKEIQEVKENYGNMFKQYLVKNQMNNQNLQREKYELVDFFEKHFIEKSSVDRKFKDYEDEIEKLKKEIEELKRSFRDYTSNNKLNIAKANNATEYSKNSEIEFLLRNSNINENQHQSEVKLINKEFSKT